MVHRIDAHQRIQDAVALCAGVRGRARAGRVGGAGPTAGPFDSLAPACGLRIRTDGTRKARYRCWWRHCEGVAHTTGVTQEDARSQETVPPAPRFSLGWEHLFERAAVLPHGRARRVRAACLGPESVE